MFQEESSCFLEEAQGLIGSDGLSRWRVALHEEKGDDFIIHFECAAEDAHHAAEQAEDACPGCEIVHVSRIKDF